MPTTTNYGWTTPADTDLVKDGAAAIRTLGSSIDTTLKAQIDAQIPDSIVDAKGDLISATADNTPARLASSGVNGDVLTVDTSTATGLKWAAVASGGMTLISTTSLSGASVTLSSIPQTYVSLYLVLYGLTNATANGVNRVDLNGATTGLDTSGTFGGSGSTRSSRIENGDGTSTLRTDSTNVYVIEIDNYTSTTNHKVGKNYGGFLDATSTDQTFNYGFRFRSNTAISSIVISNSGGNLSTGTALLYGVK